MSGLIFILQLLFLSLLSYLVYLLSYSLIRGAPYAAIGKKRLNTMIDLLDVKRGKFIDIGAGDGRIVIAAAKKGVDAYGIEINPFLAVVGKLIINRKKIKNAHIIVGDCYLHSFRDYNYVSIWGTQHMVRNLESKLYEELKPGARVVSNHFRFQYWKEEKAKDNVYLYIR